MAFCPNQIRFPNLKRRNLAESAFLPIFFPYFFFTWAETKSKKMPENNRSCIWDRNPWLFQDSGKYPFFVPLPKTPSKWFCKEICETVKTRQKGKHTLRYRRKKKQVVEQVCPETKLQPVKMSLLESHKETTHYSVLKLCISTPHLPAHFLHT